MPCLSDPPYRYVTPYQSLIKFTSVLSEMFFVSSFNSSEGFLSSISSSLFSFFGSASTALVAGFSIVSVFCFGGWFTATGFLDLQEVIKNNTIKQQAYNRK